MRRLPRRAAASLLLVAAPLTACGADDDTTTPAAPGAAEGSTTTSTSTDAAIGDVDPEAVLLTLDDLPRGYVVDRSAEYAQEGPAGGCQELQDVDVSAADDAREADVAFVGGEVGPFVFHAVTDQDPDTAKREFDNFRAAMRKPECQTFTERMASGRIATWTLEPLNTVRVGDDTIGYRISGDATALYLTFDYAVERIGDNVSLVGTARAPAVGGALPPDLSALVRRAHGKLAEGVAVPAPG
jgi:hypothetical protein